MPHDPQGAPRIPRVLSIAGSDSGGGAGIQADLKAFAACGVHGMTAVTAITAQNTVGVEAVHAVPPEHILAQVRAVTSDIGVDAVKIGMLGDLATIQAVSQALDLLPASTPVVLDPVLVAESGAELLEPSARTGLIELMLPRATVATPNLPEARALLAAAQRLPGSRDPSAASRDPSAGSRDPSAADRDASPDQLARAIQALGPRVVVLTGGHRPEPADLFYDGEQLIEIPGERHPDGAAHGSGCTHSAVLAARLAWGDDALTAARTAKQLASRAVRDGLRGVGAGAGPVDVIGLRTLSQDGAGVIAGASSPSGTSPAL
ncbi:MAG: hydroxymethylpyrimidine/phosphomethylpyrimidine kinase family protein [Solirubrobacteraceae bacterium]